MHLYRTVGDNFVQHLDGIFSFVLYDVERKRFVAARDPIGVTTLYYGYNSSMPGAMYFASEMKCLNGTCDTILSFPPGHIYDSQINSFVRWYQPKWWQPTTIPTTPIDYQLLRRKLIKAVKKRLMSEVPYGVLLSGGLDSSIIASIAARETKAMLRKQLEDVEDHDDEHDHDDVDGQGSMKMSDTGLKQSDNGSIGSSSGDEQTEAFWPRLHSFSIGLPDKYSFYRN